MFFSATVSACLLSGAFTAAGQSYISGPEANPAGGFRFSDFTVFSQYSSRPMTFGSGLASAAQSKFLEGMSTSMGWSRSRGTSSIGVSYVLSAIYRPDIPYGNLFNHSLGLDYQKEFTPRWKMDAAIHAIRSSFEASLFNPEQLSKITAVPGTVDDLASALTGASMSNDQIASILTGAPVVIAPAGHTVYDNQFLSTNAIANVRYAKSPRLNYFFGFNGQKTLRLSDAPIDPAAYVFPSTLLLSARAGMNYAWTNRTTVGFATGSTRTASNVAESQSTTTQGTYTYSSLNHWAFDLHGGVGYNVVLRSTVPGSSGARMVGGASIMFKQVEHSLVASSNFSTLDQYGIGAQDNFTSAGSWNFAKPGRKWSLNSGFTYQILKSPLTHLTGRIGTFGIARQLAGNMASILQYRFTRYDGMVNGVNVATLNNPMYGAGVHSVRLGITWTLDRGFVSPVMKEVRTPEAEFSR